LFKAVRCGSSAAHGDDQGCHRFDDGNDPMVTQGSWRDPSGSWKSCSFFSKLMVFWGFLMLEVDLADFFNVGEDFDVKMGKEPFRDSSCSDAVKKIRKFLKPLH
jgi:hypothetical protein